MPKTHFFLSVGAQWRQHDSVRGFDTAAARVWGMGGAAAEIPPSFVKLHRAALRSRKLDKLVAEGNIFNFSFPFLSPLCDPHTPPQSPANNSVSLFGGINFRLGGQAAHRVFVSLFPQPVSICPEYFYLLSPLAAHFPRRQQSNCLPVGWSRAGALN